MYIQGNGYVTGQHRQVTDSQSFISSYIVYYIQVNGPGATAIPQPLVIITMCKGMCADT